MKFMGHRGCSGRLVKIGVERDSKPAWNEVATIDQCPACGGAHEGFRPMWRAARRGEWAEVEVRLP